MREKLYFEDTTEDIKFIGVWSKNREELVVLDFACSLYKIVLVPLYESLSHEGINFAFDTTGVKTFFTSNDHLDRFIEGAS